MSSQNPNPDPRYLYHSPPKQHQQQSLTSKRKPPIAQLQLQHQQHQRRIMHYVSPSSSNSRSATNNSTTIINQSQQLYYQPPNQFINTTNTATTVLSGGSPRIQQNHVNSNSVVVTNGMRQIPFNQTTTTADKSGMEDSEERSATPDSTTEPRTPKPAFSEGDDVFFRTDDGQHVLGTVGMIHGQTLQILFGDGTQQWASFKRVKKLSCSVKEDDEPDRTNNKSGKQGPSSVPADQSASNNVGVNNNEEITCGSCGIVKVIKRVAGRKALNYSPHTAQQFNCRRCLNKSSCNNNNLPMSTILISQPVGRGKTIQLPASSGAKSSADLQRDNIESNRRSDICFHCEGNTTYNDRLHCNLCERACHLSCLSITPIPLEGDRFWDVICSACGTQNGESGWAGRTKVFSCRRSITSWSDVAHLVLSCLGTQHPGEKFFDLDLQAIPFIAKRLDCLHLPRAYKNTPDKRIFLKTALGNAKLRFLNGKDVNKKDTLWAIRDNNNHQGYPLRLPSSSSTSKTSKAPPSAKAYNQGSAKNISNSRSTVASDAPLRVNKQPSLANGGSTASLTVQSKVLASSIPLMKSSIKGNGSPPGSTSPIRSFNVTSTQYESGYISEERLSRRRKLQLKNRSLYAKKALENNTVATKPRADLITGKLATGRPKRLVPTATPRKYIPKNTCALTTRCKEYTVHCSSSRTLGKSGTKGLSPQGKKQLTPPAHSALKSPANLTVSPGKLPPLSAVSQSGRLVMKAKRHVSLMKTTEGLDGTQPASGMDIMYDDMEEDMSKVSAESESEHSSDTEINNIRSVDLTDQLPGAVRQVPPNKRKLSPDRADVRNIYTKGTNSTAMLSSSAAVDVTATNKRPKLSDDLQIRRSPNKTPLKQSKVDHADMGNKLNRPSSVMISPIANKMSNIYKSLNGSMNAGLTIINATAVLEGQLKITPVQSPKNQSPTSSHMSSIAGKAVKSASVTSPGNHAAITAPVKPSLRIRKPKVFPDSRKDSKKDKELNDSSGAVKKTGGKKISVELGKRKCRGRPMKLQSIGNGQLPAGTFNPVNTNPDYSDGKEFSVLKSTVEDFVFHGIDCSVQCLPKAPETDLDLSNLAAQVADFLQSEEQPSPPSYWKSSEIGASNLRWMKSKKDLKNQESYSITGRKVDENGRVSYFCEWTDGYGNDNCDDDVSELMYEIREADLNNPFVLWDKMDQLEVQGSPNDISSRVEIDTKDEVELVEIVCEERSNGKVKDSQVKESIGIMDSILQGEKREKDKDKDLFMVSGLGLRRKNNLALINLHSSNLDEIIDLTDSP